MIGVLFYHALIIKLLRCAMIVCNIVKSRVLFILLQKNKHAMRKILLKFSIGILFMLMCPFAMTGDENVPLVQTKGDNKRPRTITPISVSFDRDLSCVKIRCQGYYGVIIYKIVNTDSGVIITGIISDCTNDVIWLDDHSGLHILTFRLDDETEYQSQILI